MTNEKDNHLSMDQLTKALVDQGELSPKMRLHLAACPRCHAEKKKTERHLDELSRMARQMAPKPARKIYIPEKKSQPYFLKDFRLSPAFGLAIVTLFMAIAVWWPGGFESKPDVNMAAMVQELQEAQKLMTEVEMFVENALPQAYQDILTTSETELEEDFMQFIVPPTEPDNITSLFRKKGEVQC